MSKTENAKVGGSDDSRNRTDKSKVGDPLDSTVELISREVPQGVDRRTFLMRSAVVSAAGVITGRRLSAQTKTPVPASEEPKGVSGGPPDPPLSPNLYVVKEQKGPVLT